MRETSSREPSPIQYGASVEMVPPDACEVDFTQVAEEDDDDVRGDGFADDERGDGSFFDSGEDDLHGALPPVHEHVVPVVEVLMPIEQPSLVCEASNHVNVRLCDDDVTYETTRAVYSDDDRVVPPPSPRTIDILKRLFPDRDPLVSHFCDLRESYRAVADGG